MANQEKAMQALNIGLDVGSTTVKAVVCDASDKILFRDYQRHETKQLEIVGEILGSIEKQFPDNSFNLYITGSGGSKLSHKLGGRFVQEVNAVSMVVERLHPNVGSVVELGGQDAKIIIYKTDKKTGRKRKIPSMNDKCAGGTGAVIDKIAMKLNLPEKQMGKMQYHGVSLHPVAAKCGVFAETDITGLQKSGIPADQLFASLLDAIVLQNISVLTRGNTLLPEVILLGGPNTFLPALVDAWRHHIESLWDQRGVVVPEGKSLDELVIVPKNAHYYAALGAVEFGKAPSSIKVQYRGIKGLDNDNPLNFKQEKSRSSGVGLSGSDADMEDFLKQYTPEIFNPPIVAVGKVLPGYLGLDCGSTSTKAVFLDEQGVVIDIAYQLSSGNPIDDSRDVLEQLRQSIEKRGAILNILTIATTGYAKDVIKDAIGADCALVETVAHTQSALHYYKDVDVICDVGGQDIKIIIMKNGRIKDFRLNTQCSAGNGYFLQNTAQNFAVDLEDFADLAFEAKNYPEFGYGCSVFMQTDIVDFQRQGWQAKEILAGIAAVLPKNIWLYVAAIPNLASLGSRFLLQGGTQKNLAAVKTQVDFIKSRFEGKDSDVSVTVHKFCGESGAIGAALEAKRLSEAGVKTSFIGFDRLQKIKYRTHHSADTVCHFCSNECRRTFIDVPVVNKTSKDYGNSKIPLVVGETRIITGNSCDKGLVEDVGQMRTIKKGLDKINSDNPNLVDYAANEIWKSRFDAQQLTRSPFSFPWIKRNKNIDRSKFRVGIPRVLNMYSLNPLFSGYFKALGIKHLVYSDFTNEELYKSGAKRLAIDPCFPSKVALAHVHNLVYGRKKRKPVNLIFFPMINSLVSDLKGTQGSCACPTVTTTPEAVKAAMLKEGNLFEDAGIQYLNPLLDVDTPELMDKQLFQAFGGIFGLSKYENRKAVAQGYQALEQFNLKLQAKGKEVIDMLIEENRIGIVLLGRAYHNDPGLNHGILEQLQSLGYPILTQDALPQHGDETEDLFAHDISNEFIDHHLSIDDVWSNSYSENTNRKVWGAKYTARHPNLVALELSSFKCGHDAPIYTVIEQIIEKSGTPYFCFKDLDENKPAGSIKIRLETIDYFLKRYQESMFGGNSVTAAEENLRVSFA